MLCNHLIQAMRVAQSTNQRCVLPELTLQGFFTYHLPTKRKQNRKRKMCSCVTSSGNHTKPKDKRLSPHEALAYAHTISKKKN